MSQSFIITKQLRRIGFIMFVLAIVGYGLFQARDLLRGPVITLHTPQNGATVQDALVEVAGQARNISDITLNDRSIPTDEEGWFREQLLLPYGYTIMTLEARDRFGRETKTTVELVYK